MQRRTVVAIAATVLMLAPPVWLWQTSLVPSTYSVMDMGYADLGGGPAAAGHDAHGGAHLAAPVQAVGDGTAATSVRDLTGPRDGVPDVAVEVVARAERLTVGARTFDGFTLNGTSPGPEIRARQGDLVEVRLVNESVPDGVTLHWHGVDVPNAEDGVAGVTQDAVAPGEEHVYRFIAQDAGTYWYHSHQVSHRQVRDGLFGVLIVLPAEEPAGLPAETDVTAAVHTYQGQRTVAGRVGEHRVVAGSGEAVRVRVVNTDDGPMRTWVDGAPFQVAAVDGTDVLGPQPVEDTAVLLTAGGRVDLRVTVPSDGSAVRVGLGGGSTSVVVGPEDAPGPALGEVPRDLVDLLAYGIPGPSGLDSKRPDRVFDYRIGRRLGFLDGRPGMWWTINGRMFPDVPMYVVREGDVVRMRIENNSGEVHPMHLHGHHALVLSRDGVPATGSPWWVDSLNVDDGESYEIAFRADNPGVWMDHCHNLPHAKDGLVAHLAYEGVDTPFRVGGPAQNRPE